MNKAAILTQTVEQMESMNAALVALRREQPRTFAMLAEGPLEEIRRLQTQIEQLTTELATCPLEQLNASESFEHDVFLNFL